MMIFVAWWLSCIAILASEAAGLSSSPTKPHVFTPPLTIAVEKASHAVEKARQLIEKKLANIKIDHFWALLLERPPLEIVEQVGNLNDRAKALSDSFFRNTNATFLRNLTELDVICAGGGARFKPFYFLGAMQVWDAIAKRNANASPKMRRCMGSSSCGQTCFMLILQGDLTQTLIAQLSYGIMPRLFNASFSGGWSAYEADHQWNTLAKWLVRRYADRLPLLNNTVYMHVTMAEMPPRDTVVSTYYSAEDAEAAFGAVGSSGLYFRGGVSFDSGPTVNGLEDFPDHELPHLHVTMSEYETPGMVTGFELEEAVRAVEGGQDDMLAALTGYPTKSIFLDN